MEIPELHRLFLQSRRVSTDTRQIESGSIFFALRGPNFNANAFASEALDKGASVVVIDDEMFRKDERYVIVNDVLAALQQLARYHRNQLKIPVIGLTGSNGKTTTKEMMQAVLATKYVTAATKGNLNNHIGVPLTVLAIDSSIEIAVIEMGANHVGEIAALCAIANPTHGLITNIGRAHIGTFGGEDNILRAKSELYQHLIAHSGKVFINSANPILSNMAKRFPDPVFYPGAGDYYHCELLGADPYVEIKTESGDNIRTHLSGDYNFENIAAALCVGKYFKVDDFHAGRAIAEYVPGNMRSQVVIKGSNRIILDAYNANPSSMEAAIRNLASLQSGHKVALLGDMYELGDDAETEHRKLGMLLRELKIDEAYLCGVLIKSAIAEYVNGRYFASREDLVNYLTKHPITDSTILVKASRGMKLEVVVEAL